MKYTVEPVGQEAVEARSVKIRPGSLEPDRPPTAEIEAHDPTGLLFASLGIGTEVVVKRLGYKLFTGLITRPVIHGDSEEGTTVKLYLVRKAYRFLQRETLESYVYDPDGAGPNGVDAVTRNPHEFIVYRSPTGTLDADGEGPPVHGHTLDRVYRHAIGTAFLGQIVLKDSKFLEGAEVRAGGTVDVYADESELAALRRYVQSGGTYQTAGARTTIPLRHGSEEAGGNADILTLEEFTLIGDLSGTDHPTARVARDGDAGSPSWEALTLSHTANYNSSGKDAWTIASPHTFTTGTQKDALLIEVTIPGSASDASTSAVEYVAWDCSTDSDSTVTEGTIETYSAPIGGVDADWFEGDLAQEEHRLDAIAAIRSQAVSSVNPDGRWDAWVDDDFQAHFVERRGTDVESRTYSERDGTLTVLERDLFGDDLAYQIIARGAGRGTSQLVVADDDPASGLYDADRDPLGGTALYGDVPARMKRTYPAATSYLQLRRYAQADLIRFKDPREFVKATVAPNVFLEGDVGDRLRFKESRLGLNALLRIHDMELRYDFGGGGESVKVTLGARDSDIRSSGRGARSATQVTGAIPSASTGVSGLAGTGVPFDKDRFARVPFTVPEGVEVDRVFLEMQTVPFQATAKASGSTTIALTTTNNQSPPTGTSPTAVFDLSPRTVGSGASNTLTWDITGTESLETNEAFFVEGQWENETSNARWEITVVLEDNAGSPNTFTVGPYHNQMDTDDEGAFAFHISSSVLKAAGLTNLDKIKMTHKNISNFSQIIDGRSLGPTRVPAHSHGITMPSHDHDLNFGIYQYPGDGEDPDVDPPFYAEGVEWAIDPTLAATGLPSAWNTDKHPMPFGDRTKPTRVFIDVTPFLAQTAEGKPTAGIHYLFMRGTAISSGSPLNAEGLCAVAATAVVKKKEVQA